jgi:capsular polysaccharide export protein
MKIVFFAARQLHQEYFDKVRQQLNSNSVDAEVLWHKDLWKTLSGFLSLVGFKPPISAKDLTSIVADHIREKQNSRKGRERSAAYWRLFSIIKRIESRILFSIYRQALAHSNASSMVIWNGLKYRQLIAISAAESLDIQIIYMENGLLPGMTTMDAQGINYRNSVPRDLDAFEQLAPIDLTPLNTALKEQFTEHPTDLPEHYIFVPFQVNTDSQVVLFSHWIKDMFDLVKQFDIAAAELGNKMPNIVFKPHPACDQKYDELITSYQGHSKLHFDTQTATPVLIQHADAVATINSTVGIESLLLDKKLIVMGQAFYSYPSLSLIADSQQALKQALLEVPAWQPNRQHIQQLFHYLSRHYQVPGRWQEAQPDHIEACGKRLMELAK